MSKTISRKDLFQSIKALIQKAQQHIVRNINTTMLIAYFEIGKMIVEDEQKGKPRAEYADKTIRQLSYDLTKEFGKSYSKSNLEYMRAFYLAYQTRNSLIAQTLSGQSLPRSKPAAKLQKSEITQSPIGQFENPFVLILQAA